jgi:integrase
MALTDVALRKAKGREAPYRMGDSDGLYVIVQPNGAKWWRFDYRIGGVRKTMSMGIYPDIALVEARSSRDQARKLVANEVDPVEQKRKEARAKVVARGNTFGKIADDYIDHLQALGRSERTITKNTWLLKTLAAPLAHKPITDIKAGDILPILKKIEAKGHRDTAHTLRATIGTVFRFAVNNLLAEYDPTFALRGALLPVEEEHHPAIIDEKRFGGLLRAVDDYDGWITLRAALQIMALCFPRPVELRKAEWSHFDLEANMPVWTIPEHLAKMRRPHDVPLPWQARDIINGLKPISGDSKYVFPSLRSMNRVISENGMNSALRRMGYTKHEHTSHGFRSSASSILNRRKFHPDVIERALAHLEQNKVRRAYNRYEYWDERIELAQKWADICDELKARKRRSDDLV